MHEFWIRNEFVQAEFVLVKLCNSSFLKLHTIENCGECYLSNGLFLKSCASEINTTEIHVSQGSPAYEILKYLHYFTGCLTKMLLISILIFDLRYSQSVKFTSVSFQMC